MSVSGPRSAQVMNPDVEIHTGAVLEFGQRDHYGTGTLVLKLGPVEDELRRLHPALEWMVLAGRVVGPDGLGEPCEACVRVSAIPAALRPDGWRPSPDSPPEPLGRRTAGGVEGTPFARHSVQTKTPGPADFPGKDRRPDRG